MSRNFSRSETLQHQQSPEVAIVERALRNDWIEDTLERAKEIVKELKRTRFFGSARQYLALARKRFPQDVWVGQQHALCTYKDVDLPVDSRLDRALEILCHVDDPANSQSSETLGLAGAIYKYKWGFDGQREHLETALNYYLQGYEFERTSSDFPPSRYAGINAAYVLDVLAKLEQRSSNQPLPVPKARRTQARVIREEIRSASLKAIEGPERSPKTREWWFVVTLAEACFGLGVDENGNRQDDCYAEAQKWIAEALANPAVDWEFETFARQLAAIAQLHGEEQTAQDSPVYRTLQQAMGDRPHAIAGLRAGKLGLALSGGGFRASFFHIGVLARLAELDVLRHVEVLSCVSGGSIIGAFYYLEVRKLLQSVADAEITKEHYIQIVKRLENNFLQGVQQDPRNLLLSDRGAALQTLSDPVYTHTRRLGELFEEKLYSLVDDGESAQPRILPHLTIKPCGAPSDFAPKVDNWRREAKVPILILNATTLNTGHNWQFTATWMGEPPSGINTEIDANKRLRRLYYWQAEAKEYQEFRLGHAVAASAAVPLMFDPLNLNGLYEGQHVLLSDGGVHDNQGLSGLLGEDCTLLLVSDGSGQLVTQDEPSAGRFGVLQRTNDALQERIRGIEYREVMARRRSQLVRGLMFVHLTKDLEAEDVPWVGKVPAAEPPDVQAEAHDQYRTNYQVLREVQAALARLRTDLDAFTDLEARALMLSGYRMTMREFPHCIQGLPEPASQILEDWNFSRQLTELMANTGRNEAPALVKALNVGASVFGKTGLIYPEIGATLRRAFVIARIEAGVLILLLAAAILGLLRYGNRTLVIGLSVLTVAVLAAAWVYVTRRQRHWTQNGKSRSQTMLGLVLACGGSGCFSFYLREFAPLYLRWGQTPGDAPDASVQVARLKSLCLWVQLALAGALLAALLLSWLVWSLLLQNPGRHLL